MEIHIYVESDNRVSGWGTHPSPETIAVTVSEAHEVLSNPMVFKYENGELTKDLDYQEQLIQQHKSI